MEAWKISVVKQRKNCILVLLLIYGFILSFNFTEGRQLWNSKETSLMRFQNIANTIKSHDGDIVDCVYVHRQPALSHPLLRNHVIQIEPSSYASNEVNKSLPELRQSWHKNGDCTKGTIPIRRQLQTFSPPTQLDPGIQANPHYEYATVSVVPQLGKKFSGAHATLNVWNPSIGTPHDFSASQIWVVSGHGERHNSLQAGWIVYQGKYGDNQTRLFIHWTRDGYNTTGCLDHDCDGFVQVNNRYSLGGTLNPVSVYDGEQFEIQLAIYQDKSTGHWWLIIQDTPLGYWPAELFTSLSNGAGIIRWGGQIYDSEGNEEHTTTAMGSGHFADEGPGKASYFGKLGYNDDVNVLRDPIPSSLQLDVTNRFCYNAVVSDQNDDPNLGVHFYYGGPGNNAACL